MSFSHPTPIQSKEKKPSKSSTFIEKISALIGLIELGGTFGMPAKMKNKVTPKQRDRIVLVLVLLIIYFILMGIISTFYFLIQLF